LVANVPVVLDIDLPAILFQLPAEKVIGLTVGAGRLAQLRQTRADKMSGALNKYANVAYVRDELKYARNIFRRSRWRVVDMSAKPVEEATAEVVALVGGTMSEPTSL
jgi:regulator of PEP synthase PpsR (kinase-PPPase family)